MCHCGAKSERGVKGAGEVVRSRCPVIGAGAESEFVLSNMVSHGFTWFDIAKALPLMEMPEAQRLLWSNDSIHGEMMPELWRSDGLRN